MTQCDRILTQCDTIVTTFDSKYEYKYVKPCQSFNLKKWDTFQRVHFVHLPIKNVEGMIIIMATFWSADGWTTNLCGKAHKFFFVSGISGLL